MSARRPPRFLRNSSPTDPTSHVPSTAHSFVKDIDINDIRNRYLLTKPASQEQVMAETGCNVATKGVWYPDRSMVKDKDPPLYLHITAVRLQPYLLLSIGSQHAMLTARASLGPCRTRKRSSTREWRPSRS